MVTWQLTIDSNNPARMARFWAPLLGYVPQPPPDGFDSWLAYYQSVVPEEDLDGDPDDYIDRLVDPAGEGPRIWFQPVPEKKRPARPGSTSTSSWPTVPRRWRRSSRPSTPR